MFASKIGLLGTSNRYDVFLAGSALCELLTSILPIPVFFIISEIACSLFQNKLRLTQMEVIYQYYVSHMAVFIR